MWYHITALLIFVTNVATKESSAKNSLQMAELEIVIKNPLFLGEKVKNLYEGSIRYRLKVGKDVPSLIFKTSVNFNITLVEIQTEYQVTKDLPGITTLDTKDPLKQTKSEDYTVKVEYGGANKNKLFVVDERYTVTVQFQGRMRNDTTGIYFSTYAVRGEDVPFAALGRPDENAFPILDTYVHAKDRTIKLTIIHPSKYTVAGSPSFAGGPMCKRNESLPQYFGMVSSTCTDSTVMDWNLPHISDLAFVMGELVNFGKFCSTETKCPEMVSPTIHIFGYEKVAFPPIAADSVILEIFDDISKLYQNMSDYLGKGLPGPVLGFVVLPNRNISKVSRRSLIGMTPENFWYDPNDAKWEGKRSGTEQYIYGDNGATSLILTPAWVKYTNLRKIAQQMGKQYFGFSTLGQDDFGKWLNGGIRRWLGFKVVDQLYPEAMAEQEMIHDVLQNSLQYDCDGVHELKRGRTANNSEDARFQYNRAALIIRMLTTVKTDSLPIDNKEKGEFDEILRRYVHSTWQNNSDPSLFNTYLKGGSLEPFEYFESWYNTSGYPCIYMQKRAGIVKTGTYDNVSLIYHTTIFTQQQFTYANHSIDRTKRYIPIEYYVYQKNESNNYTEEWVRYLTWVNHSNENHGNYYTNTNGSEVIIVDMYNKGYYRVYYDDHTWADVLGMLRDKEKFQKIPPEGRAKIIDDTFHLMLRNRSKEDTQRFWATINCLKPDRNWLPWATATKHLLFLYRRLNERADLNHIISVIILPAYEELGFVKRPTDSLEIIKLRNIILFWANTLDAYFYDYLAQDMVNKYKTQGIFLGMEPNTRDIDCCRSVSKDIKNFDAIKETLNNPLRKMTNWDPTERKFYLQCMSCSQNFRRHNKTVIKQKFDRFTATFTTAFNRTVTGVEDDEKQFFLDSFIKNAMNQDVYHAVYALKAYLDIEFQRNKGQSLAKSKYIDVSGLNEFVQKLLPIMFPKNNILSILEELSKTMKKVGLDNKQVTSVMDIIKHEKDWLEKNELARLIIEQKIQICPINDTRATTTTTTSTASTISTTEKSIFQKILDWSNECAISWRMNITI